MKLYAVCPCYVWPLFEWPGPEQKSAGRCGRCDEPCIVLSMVIDTPEEALAVYIEQYGGLPVPMGGGIAWWSKHVDAAMALVEHST